MLRTQFLWRPRSRQRHNCYSYANEKCCCWPGSLFRSPNNCIKSRFSSSLGFVVYYFARSCGASFVCYVFRPSATLPQGLACIQCSNKQWLLIIDSDTTHMGARPAHTNHPSSQMNDVWFTCQKCPPALHVIEMKNCIAIQRRSAWRIHSHRRHN